jgi:hypothetical protein
LKFFVAEKSNHEPIEFFEHYRFISTQSKPKAVTCISQQDEIRGVSAVF